MLRVRRNRGRNGDSLNSAIYDSILPLKIAPFRLSPFPPPFPPISPSLAFAGDEVPVSYHDGTLRFPKVSWKDGPDTFKIPSGLEKCRVCLSTKLCPRNSLSTKLPGAFSAVPAGLILWLTLTQDCVLGYYRPSLRDWFRFRPHTIERIVCSFHGFRTFAIYPPAKS